MPAFFIVIHDKLLKYWIYKLILLYIIYQNAIKHNGLTGSKCGISDLFRFVISARNNP